VETWWDRFFSWFSCSEVGEVAVITTGGQGMSITPELQRAEEIERQTRESRMFPLGRIADFEDIMPVASNQCFQTKINKCHTLRSREPNVAIESFFRYRCHKVYI
jgi:hypothetical protein